MRHAAARTLGLITATLAATLANAGTPQVIDFETPTSYASIAAHYAGGTDSAGAAGPDLGADFGADLLALQNDALGPYFAGAPSPLGVMFVAGSDAFVNVAAGFTGTVSLWYASNSFVLQGVNVYSGLNGTGRLLASFNLADNAQASGCSSAPYCHFDQLSSSFAGIARSIGFANASGAAAFDNISISAVPEPAAALMLSLGLATLMLGRRRS